MSEQEITTLFETILSGKMPGRVLGIDRKRVDNYKRKGLPSLGLMLEILYNANLIKVTANEPEGPKK